MGTPFRGINGKTEEAEELREGLKELKGMVTAQEDQEPQLSQTLKSQGCFDLPFPND